MKVSTEAKRLAKFKEKKEFSVATLQFDVTFCTPIPCAPSVLMLRYVKMSVRRFLADHRHTKSNQHGIDVWLLKI